MEDDQLPMVSRPRKYGTIKFKLGTDSFIRRVPILRNHVHRTTTFQCLPLEILHDIFSRMPIHSIGQARCTCKQWYKILTDCNFIYYHLTFAMRNPGHLVLMRDDPKSLFTDWQCTCRHSTLYVETVGSNLSGVRINRGKMMPDRVSTLNSSGGLVLYFVWSKPSNYYLVANPITGEEVKVLDRPSGIFCNSVGLGLSWETKQYKLIGVGGERRADQQIRVSVYTLGTDQAWRDIPSIPFRTCHQPIESSGCLFWEIAYSMHNYPRKGRQNIMSIDIGSETLRTWSGPKMDLSQTEDTSLVKFQDTVAYVKGDYSHHGIEIWVLRDQDNEAWVKEYKIGRSACPGRRPHSLLHHDCSILSSWMNDGDFVVRVRSQGVLRYDAKHGKFTSLSLPPEWGTIREVFSSHVASLVSPMKVRY